MAAGKRERLYALAVVFTVAALEIGKSPARAQFGMGFEIFRPVPSPTQFINEHALVRAGAAQNLPSRNVSTNNANSYINRIRDNGFSSHYGVESRRSPGFEVDRRREQRASQARTNVPTPAPVVTPVETDPRPVHPIGTFFNSARLLVWPSESPVTDDLKPKRDISDQTCLIVKDLVERYRSAPITTVTDARRRLLDYGQPALRVIRSVSTPQVAESFHIFMLSLYDSLAAAASPPQGT